VYLERHDSCFDWRERIADADDDCDLGHRVQQQLGRDSPGIGPVQAAFEIKQSRHGRASHVPQTCFAQQSGEWPVGTPAKLQASRPNLNSKYSHALPANKYHFPGYQLWSDMRIIPRVGRSVPQHNKLGHVPGAG
jgi:hypothetical protein